MKVKARVHVMKGAEHIVLEPGDEVPEGVEVTNPDAIDEISVEEAAEGEKPRRRRAAESE
jgi:hypothetical protein